MNVGDHIFMDNPKHVRILGRVTHISDVGFNFQCVNGAWDGFFNYEDRAIYQDADWSDHPISADVVLARGIGRQPPAEIIEQGYQVIISWMTANP